MRHQEQSSSVLGKRTAATIEGENGALVKQELKKTKHDETKAHGHVRYGAVSDAGSSEDEDELGDERDDDAAYQMECDQDNQAQVQEDDEDIDTGDDLSMANLRDDEAERPSHDSPITIRSSPSSTPEPSLDVLQILVNNTKAPSATQANKSPGKQPESKPILKKVAPKRHGQTNRGDDLERLFSSAHRSESHWHLDGSIVVLVGKTLFKLHRSALTRQSKLFEEKIDAYERDGKRVQYSGCPAIRMEGDPEDFDVVLNALQDGFAFMSREDIPISTLCSLLIGAHAFDFGSLTNWALKAFISMWSDVDEVPAMPETKPYALESVRLVRECRKHGLDAPEFDDVMKMAMYELVRSSGFGIREEGAWVDENSNDDFGASAMEFDDSLERRYEGGSQHRARSASFAGTHQSPSRRTPSRAYLRNLLPNDVRILVRAREQLMLQWVESVARPPYIQSCSVEGCVNEGVTADSRRLDGQSSDAANLPATPVTSDAASSSNGRSSELPTQAQPVPVLTQVTHSSASPRLSHAWLNAIHYSGLFEERMNDPMIGFAILAGLVDDEYESRSFAPSQNFGKREKDKWRSSTRPKSTQSTQRSSPKKKKTEDIVGALSVMQIDWETHGFCAECETKIVNIFANKRKRVWDELDRWLELI